MSYLSNFLLKLSKNSSNTKIKDYENFTAYEVNALLYDIENISESSLNDIIESCSERDNISIDLLINGGSSIEYEKYESFINEIEVIKSIEPIETISINIVINKRIKENTLSVYSMEKISEHIDKLTINQLLSAINEKTKDGNLIMEIMDNSLINPYYSELISFKSKTNNFIFERTDRKTFIEKRKNICNYLSSDKFDFSPNDFEFKGNLNNTIEKKFNILKVLFSLIYIFNISQIEESNSVYLKIDGYKSWEFSVDLDKIDTKSISQYYEIFHWVYTEGNISDKVEIARNIISLYLINTGKLDIDQTALKAIESNYKIYLKQNVEKYLEVRSKIIEFLFNMNQQISEVTSSITKGFINNLIAILSFFVSVTIMNSLSEDRLNNIFTVDITIIAIFIIIFSFIYLWFTIYEVKKEKDRMNKIYFRLKKAYDEILVPKDIDNIFKDDEDFNEDISEIDEKVKKYKWIWIITLIAALVLIILLSRESVYKILRGIFCWGKLQP